MFCNFRLPLRKVDIGLNVFWAKLTKKVFFAIVPKYTKIMSKMKDVKTKKFIETIELLN